VLTKLLTDSVISEVEKSHLLDSKSSIVQYIVMKTKPIMTQPW
jgi:hypothetical protein